MIEQLNIPPLRPSANFALEQFAFEAAAKVVWLERRVTLGLKHLLPRPIRLLVVCASFQELHAQSQSRAQWLHIGFAMTLP